VNHGNSTIDPKDGFSNNAGFSARLAETLERDNKPSRDFERSESSGSSFGVKSGASGAHPPATEHRMPSRSSANIPTLGDLEQGLRTAFATGDPEIAHRSAQQVLAAYSELSLECSRLRFELNFGTSICLNCNGLRAGPDVVATCYQVQRCDFTHIRSGDATPTQARLAALLDR
jgi:hypothetical protein